MKFAELQTGDVFRAGPYVVTEEEVLAFAKAYDPQWFHIDPAAAAHGRFGGLIASGWHTCSIAMRLLVPVALEGSDAMASPGVEHIRWLQPVRPGDALSLEARVLDKRVSSTRESRGVLRWHWRLSNQDGTDVMELEATTLYDLVPRGA